MAFKTFVDSVSLPASDLNTYLMKQVIVKCTSGTRPGSPDEGLHIWETDTDRGYRYDGSGWLQVAGEPLWSTPTLVNSWADEGSLTFSSARIDNLVMVRGYIGDGDAGDQITTLTTSDGNGYSHRPDEALYFPSYGVISSTATIVRIDVATNGVVDLGTPGSGTVTNMPVNFTFYVA